MNGEKLLFRMKLTPEEVEQHLLSLLRANNQINGLEEKYFTGMNKQGRCYMMEFIVPLSEVKTTN